MNVANQYRGAQPKSVLEQATIVTAVDGARKSSRAHMKINTYTNIAALTFPVLRKPEDTSSDTTIGGH